MLRPLGKFEIMNQAAQPRKCKSMVSATILFFVFNQGIEYGSAIYITRLILKLRHHFTSGGLCASEVDRTLIHYDVILTKEVAAMVHIIPKFRYHTIRLQTTQTTSGPRGTITK